LDQSIHREYAARPQHIPERKIYVEPDRPVRKGISLASVIAVFILILTVGWLTYQFSSRGWEQIQQDVKSSLQSAAYAAKETSRDAALTTKVKTALVLSKSIPSSQIEVSSLGDVVTLHGDVASEDVRTRAAAIAQDVPGVREVHNHLFVVSPSQ
jgi:hyperosmotically inducible protein